MKKFLKVTGIVLGVFVILIVIAAVSINMSGFPTYEKGDIVFKHRANPEALERGKKLTATLCAGCHANFETGKLTGKLMLDAPEEFGMVYAPNITGDKQHGIGDWTDGEIVYLLRTGIKRDGSYAPPWMAKLPKMADEDINAIIAFLRSNDEIVKADPTPDKPCEPSFLAKFLANVAFKPLPYPGAPIKMPDTSNKVELGKYLAFNLDCFSCHSADFKTNDYLDPEKSEGYFAGGNKPLDLKGNVMITPNLTPDAKTGIGNWTPDQFLRAVKYGQKEGEPALRYPMLPYIRLTDDEIIAIFTYLKTIPPIENEIKRSAS